MFASSAGFIYAALWADGQSTLQLHQQRQAVWASAYTEGSLVVPPDSEIVAPVSILSPSGIPPDHCSMIGLNGVLVGPTFVDTWSAEVL